MRKTVFRKKQEMISCKKREMVSREEREINPRKNQEMFLRKDHDSFRVDNKKPIIATHLKLTKEKLSQTQRKRTVPILYV